MKKTIFFGDSITQGFEELNRIPHTLNLGIGGDKTINLVGRFVDVINEQPEQLFVMIGINDLLVKNHYWQDYISIDFDTMYHALLTLIKDNLPHCTVYLSSILPIEIEHTQKEAIYQDIIKMNAYIQKQSHHFGFTYIDLYSHFVTEKHTIISQYTTDGVHLSAEGYDLYYSVIKDLLL